MAVKKMLKMNTQMVPETRNRLVMFFALTEALKFSADDMATRTSGRIKGIMSNMSQQARTSLSLFMAARDPKDSFTDAHAKQQDRLEKMDITGAAMYDAAHEFMTSGYDPRMLMIMRAFNDGVLIAPDGTPMNELQPEDVVDAEKWASGESLNEGERVVVENLVRMVVANCSSSAASLRGAKERYFWQQLAESFAQKRQESFKAGEHGADL